MFELKITGTETIKPASPTPPPLRVFNLSLLDQLVPQMFVPLIFYYVGHKMGTPSPSTAEISRRLKTSLSQSLVHFYPLAGRFADDSWVDCNDQGVEFHESRVHCQLQDLLRIPDEQSLSQLVSCHHTCTKSGREDVLLAVQANFFDCGGLALGVSISHFIGDMSTIVAFLTSWASTASDATIQTDVPLISRSPLFPHRPGIPRFMLPVALNPVMKRFVFSESNIEDLRQKRSSPARGGRPTRVEALSALVCRCMARATRKVGATEERVLFVNHAVNLRQRMEPPLSDSTFGNFWLMVSTSCQAERELCEDMQGCLEVQLSNAFKKIDGEFVRELQGPNGYSKAMESLTTAMEKHAGKDIDLFIVTSWCRFPVYRVDFGWGEPEWVSPAPIPVKNGSLLMDRRGNGGIEVWVNLNGEEMAKFERDEELLAFVFPPTTA